MKTTTFFSTLIALALMGTANLYAQYGLGTNTPNAQAALHIESASHGVLIPNVSLTAATTLFTGVTATADHESMLVYNTNTLSTTASGLSGPGFYYWSGGVGGSWVRLQSSSAGSIAPATIDPGANGQVLTTSGTGATATVGWQTPTVATTSHWRVENPKGTFTTADATSNTQNIYQEGDVSVGTTTNRASLSFSGALFGSVRTHTLTSAITYTDDDFAVVFTKSLNGILTLPDATTNTGRIIGLYNQSGTNSAFISRTTLPSGMTLADVVKVTPDGFVRVYAKAAALFISDGSTWYPIGAR